MKRDWGPGDVAALSIGGEDVVGLVVDAIGLEWRIAGHSYYKSIGVGNDALIQNARPLVVIDPEDREQVERLEREFARLCGWVTGNESERRAEFLQAALRSLIEPPKPEEPTGRYAVVEDETAGEWVRADLVGRCQWNLIGTESWSDYDQIPVVRVLSEGVQS